jgi:4-aminobutyrate aminotransferase
MIDLLPKIKVPPPGPKSIAWADRLIGHETPGCSSISIGKIPIFWEEAHGSNVVDVDGNIYIDLTAGFCVAVVGHSNPKIVQAIARQSGKLLHSQGALNPCIPRVELLEKLATITPPGLTKGVILTTGAEAVEFAFKTSKLFTQKQGLFAFHGGFHGKTFGALSLTSRYSYKSEFGPLLPGIFHFPFAYCYRCTFGMEYPDCDLHCAKYIERVLEDPASGVGDVGGMLVEPIQGHEGWIIPPDGFIQELRRICTERDILLIVDEILEGFGRTGAMFTINHFGVVPDIMTLGKGLASGFPISACMAKPEIMESWQSRDTESTHSSTFLGHPVGCAAALASISEIEEKNLVQRSSQLGGYFMERMQAIQSRYSIVGDVRGKGLLIGMEIVRNRKTKEPGEEEAAKIIRFALEQGVILNRGGRFENVLKMSPPLVITQDQLDCAADILERSIALVDKG